MIAATHKASPAIVTMVLIRLGGSVTTSINKATEKKGVNKAAIGVPIKW